MSILADRLRELRATESQASFAAAVGINRVQYAKYESGVNVPSVEVLANICRVHSVSADWLLGIERGGNTAIASGKNSVAIVGSGKVVSAAENPACAKCPYKKKLMKLEKLLK